MTEAAPDLTPQTYLFEGFRLAPISKEPIAQLTRLSDGKSMVFSWTDKTFKGLRAGRTYDIPTSPDGSRLSFGRAENEQPIQDVEHRQALVTAHHASRAGFAALAKAAKLAKADIDLDIILRPLVKPYAECRTFEAQMAFEALVLTALRKARMAIR